MNGGRNAEVAGKVSLWDVGTRAPELVLDLSQPQAKILAKRAAPPSPHAAGSSAPSAGSAFVHASALRTMATSPTANLLVTTGDDGLLKVWNPGKGTLLRRLKLAAPASALGFNADGTVLAAGTAQGEVRLWDTRTWREFPPYSSRQGQINALQFLPGHRLLAIAGGQPKVSIVDLNTREVVKELVHMSASESCDAKGCVRKRSTQAEAVLTLALLDGSPFLLTASQTGQVAWDIETWTEVDRPVGFPENWSGLG
jgi:WD40 repeat protein